MKSAAGVRAGAGDGDADAGTDAHGLGDTEWFEAPEPGWKGYVTHAGGVRMAQVQIMRRMAEAMETTNIAPAATRGWRRARQRWRRICGRASIISTSTNRKRGRSPI